MNIEKGKIIYQAYDIIRKTIQEINMLKTDLEDVILSADSSLKFAEQYSYGPTSLYLKPNHTFLFQKVNKDPDDKKIIEERDFAMICIFYDEGGLDRINLKDEPEIWFCLIDIEGNKERCRPWDIYALLKKNELKYFAGGNLMVGGEIYNYHWKRDETDEEWQGKFVGYALTDIKDIEFLKENVVVPLFSEST